MDYEPFKNMPGVQYLFQTHRPDARLGSGSTYAHFDDLTTQRNRSGEHHQDKTTGMEPRSGKTIYMEPRAVRTIQDWLEDRNASTRLVPVIDKDGKPTGKARIVALETFTQQPTKLVNGQVVAAGPPVVYKAGQAISEVPYVTKPAKGLHPVEILGSRGGVHAASPKGEVASERNVHYGSKITEVLQKLDDKVKQGQAAVERGAARGGGGAYGGAIPNIENTSFQQYMKMNRGGFVEKTNPAAGNWKFI